MGWGGGSVRGDKYSLTGKLGGRNMGGFAPPYPPLFGGIAPETPKFWFYGNNRDWVQSSEVHLKASPQVFPFGNTYSCPVFSNHWGFCGLCPQIGGMGGEATRYGSQVFPYGKTWGAVVSKPSVIVPTPDFYQNLKFGGFGGYAPKYGGTSIPLRENLGGAKPPIYL